MVLQGLIDNTINIELCFKSSNKKFEVSPLKVTKGKSVLLSQHSFSYEKSLTVSSILRARAVFHNRRLAVDLMEVIVRLG